MRLTRGNDRQLYGNIDTLPDELMHSPTNVDWDDVRQYSARRSRYRTCASVLSTGDMQDVNLEVLDEPIAAAPRANLQGIA